MVMICALGLFSGLKAQSFQFLQPGVSGFPQITEFQDQFSFYFFLRNASTAPYTGNLRVFVEVNGSAPDQVDSIYVQNFAVGDSILFVPQNYTVDNPPYVLGRNGVVIWIVDDDLKPVSNFDSLDVFIVDRPALRIGGLGLPGFPGEVESGDLIDFSVHIENVFTEDFDDSLGILLTINGESYEIFAPGKVKVPAESGILFEVEDFRIDAPPFWVGRNLVEVQPQGQGDVLNIPNYEREVEMRGPVSVLAEQNDWLRVYPVPVRGSFRVEIPLPRRLRQLRLVDLAGRSIAEYAPANAYQVPNNLPAGSYFLHAELDNGERIFRKIQFMP